MTTPLSTATPASAMKPTAAGMLNDEAAPDEAEDAADERERDDGEDGAARSARSGTSRGACRR